MRLIGLLVTLAVLGYTTYIYLGSSNTTSPDGVKTRPVEYVDQAKQSTDAINEAMKKQREQLDGAK